MNDLMIEAAGLTKAYGTTAVLRGVDLAVGRGEVFAVLGPNGAGKTTTVRILATLSAADSGHARVAGADVVRERRLVRGRIALTGQYAALDATQTGRENLVMMARLTGLNRTASRARAGELLDRFALQDAADRQAGGYSGGMRRRLDLAASLVGRPSVIFLDEPTTGLDPRSRQELWAVVGELAAAGTTVLLTTQYLEEADQLADRIAVIDDGRVVAEGTAAELKARVAGSRIELTSATAGGFEHLRRCLGRQVVEQDPAARTLSVPMPDEAARIRQLLDDVDPDGTLITRFAVRQASLDDVFLTLTGHRAASTATAKETAHV